MDKPQGIDLRHERFRGEVLVAAELHQADADFADFTGATLARADLSSGRLRFAALSGADLESVDLFGADLRYARLDHADLRTAKLNDAQLDYADFAGANLANADLRGQRLGFAQLTEVNLGEADLAGADLRHACLRRADLGGADLRGALLDYADLDGANLAGADLRGASLRYAKSVDPAQIDQSTVDETTVLPFWFEDKLCGLERRRHKFPLGRRASIVSVCVFGACVLGASVLGVGVFGANVRDVNVRDVNVRDVNVLLGLGAPSPDNAMPGTRGVVVKPSVAASVHGGVTVVPPAALDVPAGTIAGAPTPLVLDAQPVPMRQDPMRQDPVPMRQELAWARLPVLDAATAREAAVTMAQVQQGAPQVSSKPLTRIAALVLPDAGRGEVAPASVAPNMPPRIVAGAVKVSAAELTPRLDWPASEVTRVSPVDAGAAVSDLPVLAALEGSGDALMSRPDSAIEIIATVPKSEPLTVLVSLNRQRLDVYRGAELVESVKISSGKRGHETRTGVYSILQKRRDHRSNLYNNAPMPWMQRLTRTGTALHGGAIPGYPASHGCVRLPHGFAPRLFEMTSLGENVVVSADRVVPKAIEHDVLSKLSTPPQPVGVLEPVRDPAVNLKRGAPLRILLTRRTQRDRTIDVQYLLASMGHLRLQNFTGRVGNETIAAIKAFQQANDLARTGNFTDALVKQVYAAAGKEEPPEGRLFVRQQFSHVLDVPVAFREPNRPLGTHLFSVTGQALESGEPRWTAITLEGDAPSEVLDRITVPNGVRQAIAEFVTPGSSFIVADKSINAAILPEGDDFLVWAKHSPKVAAPRAPAAKKAVRKRSKPRRAASKPRATTSKKRTVKRRSVRPSTGPRGLFSRR